MTPHPGEGFPSPAETQTTPEDLDAAFTEARDTFYAIPFEPEFEALCAERNIDVENTEHPAYWAAVSDFSRRTTNAQREQGASEKQLAINELVASTADYIYSEAYLEASRNNAVNNPNGFKMAKRIASDYNGMIRNAATEWPELKASEMASRLVKVANVSVGHPALAQNAPRKLEAVIRGAQHEMAFGQVLDKSGRQYRESDITEDVEGIDYVTEDSRGNPLYVDVKASNNAIRKRGSNENFVFTGPQKMIIRSPFTDKELNDSFHVPDELAEQKVAEVEAMLDARTAPQLAYSSGQ